MEPLIERLRALAIRKERFTFDLRGQCQIYDGIVSAFAATQGEHANDPSTAAAHALAHEGIVGAWRDPRTNEIHYDSYRLFTDLPSAGRFAREQGQRSVYNLTRQQEIMIDQQDPSSNSTFS